MDGPSDVGGSGEVVSPLTGVTSSAEAVRASGEAVVSQGSVADCPECPDCGPALSSAYAHGEGWATRAKQEVAKRMRYWRQGESARRTDVVRSTDGQGRLELGLTPVPFAPAETDRYMVFQPWHGGFNNDRMSFEIALAWAIVTRRTLVIPPAYHWYLLDISEAHDYFDDTGLHSSWNLISFEQFASDIGLVIPGHKEGTQLHAEIHHPVWTELLKRDDVVSFGERETHQMVWCVPSCPTNTTSADAVALRRFRSDNSKLLDVYTEPSWRDTRIFYIPERKLLGNFYRHFWFQDRRLQLDVARAVRDTFHYHESLIETAAHIIANLPLRYNAAHIRRGDFQYDDVRNLEPAEIMDNTADVLIPQEALYIATDERNDSLVPGPWRARYTAGVFTMRNFSHIVEMHNVPKIWYGMLDQLVCTQAKNFVGSRLSTFTGYIYRMRGYMRAEHNEVRFTSEGPGVAAARAVQESPYHPDDPTWKPDYEWASWPREHPEGWWWGRL